ncbi:EAL domain-containing protein [Scleromatobacter humisilvae]|uniref:EAL domain-containing protein n=1 Tax=Scleromatobacter humisilvae TaxID=2897159 RepID=A0A9X2C0J9_9BURK|nr:EAL domain-containing protein [Scleromatobacter humisilvae]MCK9684814.1 EAL domain-containing protein [Scleromatobacter humisilvae]
MRVLYVEDNEQDADLTCRRLARLAPDIAIETVHTLADARERLAAQELAGTLPDVLLVDMRLPDGNGLELLGEVRQRGLGVAVVMLTGSGDEALVVTALRSGADDYVVKAGSYIERLPATLADVVETFREASVHRSTPILVLYAEPSASDVDLLQRHLARYAPHVQVEAVSSAQEALARLPPEVESGPDVLLLDFKLPGMNALDVVREVRHERHLNVPIIVITGHGDETSAAQTLKLGATDYLVKQDDLLHRLPVAIENAWYRAQLERERGALRESEERFRQMAESIGDVFYLSDPKRRLALYVSPAFERIFRMPVSAVYADWRAWLAHVHEDDRETVRQHMDRLHQGELEVEFRVCPPGGETRFVVMRVYVVRDGAGRDVRRAGVIQDITERKAQDARIEHLAYHDSLTGLPNRTMLMDRLGQALSQAQRLDQQLAVLFIDLDRFKLVNDSLGHHVGDQLLQEIARRLRTTLRDADTVARVGGDEFQVVVANVGGPTGAARIAEKLMRALGEPFTLEGQELHVTASLGLSLFPRDGDSGALLLKYADIALYEAKGEGRNAYRFFSPEMNAQAHGRLRLENDLRRAVERHELELHYQPQLDLATGEVCAVEALVRWRHPVRGLVLPNAFIPMAEETGLVLGIGEWVLNEACRQVAQWQREGVADGLRVAVNISARQLQRAGLDTAVRRALSLSGLPAPCLELEITESSVMLDPLHAQSVLQSLRELGVLLSIDDFGTGYSSLAYLKRLPLDRLKIDRSFIGGIPTDSDDAAIVETIIVMTHKLGLRVIAEGVETLEQRLQLVNQGCDEMQGFLLAHPVPAEELPPLLERLKEAAAAARPAGPA